MIKDTSKCQPPIDLKAVAKALGAEEVPKDSPLYHKLKRIKDKSMPPQIPPHK